MKKIRFKNIFLFLILGFFVSSCVVQKSPVSGSKRAYGYSWEQEVNIGKQADQQIQQQYGVYDDEEVLQYVQSVGQEVLSVSHMRRDDTPQEYRNTEFYFRVLNCRQRLCTAGWICVCDSRPDGPPRK